VYKYPNPCFLSQSRLNFLNFPRCKGHISSKIIGVGVWKMILRHSFNEGKINLITEFCSKFALLIQVLPETLKFSKYSYKKIFQDQARKDKLA
jgi:hypothetical protein